MTCKFDCSHVHTKTKTEIGLLMLSCVADSLNLALDASVTEAAGNENAVARSGGADDFQEGKAAAEVFELALYRFGGEAVSPDAGRILFGEHRRFRF